LPEMTEVPPKVSVLVVTYNQEAFIGGALESALEQRTDFDFEIVVGEDGSSDGTRGIVGGYAQKHPQKIRAFLRPENLGPSKLGIQGRNNFVATYRSCRGEYIAFLDGDDYWTDPLKLEKQVAFLNAHPDATLCSHPATVSYSDGRQPLWPSPLGFSSRPIRPIEDILPILRRKENLELPLSCVMIRNGLVREFPGWFYEVFNHDIALQWLLAEKGPVGFLNDCMAVIRKHGAGLSRLYDSQPDFCWEMFLKLHRSIDRHLNYRYRSVIKEELAEEWRYRARACRRRGEWGGAFFAWLQSLWVGRTGGFAG